MIALDPDPDDDVLDVRGAMALLKIGRDAVYEAVARLDLPHRRIGRHIRFSRTALLRWLDSGAASPPCGPEQGVERGR